MFLDHTVVYVKATIFCDVTPCIPVQVHRRFGDNYCLHLHGRIVNQARNQKEGDMQSNRLWNSTRLHENEDGMSHGELMKSDFFTEVKIYIRLL